MNSHEYPSPLKRERTLICRGQNRALRPTCRFWVRQSIGYASIRWAAARRRRSGVWKPCSVEPAARMLGCLACPSAEEGRPAVDRLHLASRGCPAVNALLAAVNSATLLNGFTWIELGHYIRNRRLRKGLWTLITSVVIGYFLNEV
jgi:hypothetical protein